MKPKIASEAKTRENILSVARHFNCETEVKQIFAKYDTLLKNCTNQQEREAIAHMGIIELHRYISSDPGSLQIGNKFITK